MERENRRWRWGGGFALIAGLVVVIGGAQRVNDPKVIEAGQFIVRDKDGTERVRLGLSSGGVPALFLRGKDGHERGVLQASDEDDSGSFQLYGSGEGLKGLSVWLDGGNRTSNSPSLMLRRDDKARINLNVNATPGGSWLRFEDENGTLLQFPEPTVRQLSRP